MTDLPISVPEWRPKELIRKVRVHKVIWLHARQRAACHLRRHLHRPKVVHSRCRLVLIRLVAAAAATQQGRKVDGAVGSGESGDRGGWRRRGRHQDARFGWLGFAGGVREGRETGALCRDWGGRWAEWWRVAAVCVVSRTNRHYLWYLNICGWIGRSD